MSIFRTGKGIRLKSKQGFTYWLKIECPRYRWHKSRNGVGHQYTSMPPKYHWLAKAKANVAGKWVGMYWTVGDELCSMTYGFIRKQVEEELEEKLNRVTDKDYHCCCDC